MSSFLCFVCHSTVNADTNEDVREKYREVIGMNLCQESHLCFICCHFLNKMWLFKSICLKRTLEYPVLFSEKGAINLQKSDTQVAILCPEDMCIQHLNTRIHFHNNNENSQSDVESENKYVQLHHDRTFTLHDEDRNFDIIPENLLKIEPAEDNYNKDIFFHDDCTVFVNKINNFDNKTVNLNINNDIYHHNIISIDKINDSANLVQINTEFDSNINENLSKNNLNDVDINYLAKDNNLNHDKLINDSVNNTCIDNDMININNDNDSQNLSNDNSNNDTESENSTDLLQNTDFNGDNDVEFGNNDMINESNDMINESNDMISQNNDIIEVKSKKNKKGKKKYFLKRVLSLEEQKKEINRNRKEKKYLEAVFKCHSCALGFLFKESYQTHMMRHEESNGEHRCSVCTLRFASLAVLRSHRLNHSERYTCRTCSVTVTRRRRQTHLRLCRGERDSDIACHLCGNVFSGVNNFEQHLKRVHQPKTSNRIYTCNICGKNYRNQPALRTHMITHINKKFPCDYCNALFSSPYTLNQHKKKHTSQTEFHYCDVCKLSYSSRKGLLAHRRNALAHRETVYKCPTCDRTCPSLRSLQAHTSAVHERTKHLACNNCPARYSTRKGLLRHLLTHKNEVTKQTPLCHSCGESFKSTSILKRHLKNVCEKDKLDDNNCQYYEQ